ncbi:hypothetical protein [Alloyangia pacifica]|uniref:Uncharacterized protein n=1 Tax=Alloyangia pacifica TaxID=311180 RepID=A0A1I6QL90_9RHOB|nr:hypothetical protein [Alloyangia pacifica]SDF92217.1 hypothetical protein SAMN04488245_101142 [Alloyangia pacifica]SFS53132.1 hypothetical protein SAMN04488050_102143 [Alloyangia pacifica]
MTAMREDIWRDLYEKRDDLIRAIEAAHASPPRDFTEGDRREWQEIEHALDYTPQKWADQQRSS